MMGGRDAVRKAAAEAANKGGLANWRWSLKLTSMLLRLDPQDAEARKVRAAAARPSGSARRPPMRVGSTSLRRCSSRAS